jgi:hypothetical protein
MRTGKNIVNYTEDGRNSNSPPLPYLPIHNNTNGNTRWMCGNLPCFEAGEDRTSENIVLISVQTLFLRDHNRVASQLAIVNPTWSDETLYQEARRIVIAELQHITFNEYRPVLD